jgi:hypothetical protein
VRMSPNAWEVCSGQSTMRPETSANDKRHEDWTQLVSTAYHYEISAQAHRGSACRIQ